MTGPAEGLETLALRADGDRFAVGGGFGVIEADVAALCEDSGGSVGCAAGPQAPPRRWSALGAVFDLDYAPDGALWVASSQGLWRIDAEGRVEVRNPAAGEDARWVEHVRAVEGLVVAGTRAGAYVSARGVRWSALDARVPAAPIGALDVEAHARGRGRHRVWLALGERVYRADYTGAEAQGVLQVLIPGRPTGQPPVDVRAGIGGASVVVVYPGGLAWQTETDGRWSVVYPVLPPGALATRLSEARAGLWLGTDRGLLGAADLEAAWQRTSAPAGTWPAGQVVTLPGGVLAVSGGGLLVGHWIATPLATDSSALSGAAPAVDAHTLADEPPLDRVHRAALAYAGLEPGYFAGLRRGLGRRGWLPAMSLRAGAAYDSDTTDGLDQSFTYGQLNDLYDHGSARSRDFEGSVTLTWDLRELAYPTDAPELSREARQVVGLRDNLLDEVNQLYFDRRRASIALRGFADRNDPEAVALAIRCDELAAGLDAWTGGWFSAQLARGRAGRATHSAASR